jgi:hypothetical protein
MNVAGIFVLIDKGPPHCPPPVAKQYLQGFAPWRDLQPSFPRDINRERTCAGSHAAKKMLASGMTGPSLGSISI